MSLRRSLANEKIVPFMTGPASDPNDFGWTQAGCSCAHEYLLPQLEDVLESHGAGVGGARVLDLGCGNGAVTAWLAARGLDVVGVDPSPSGLELARAAHPELEFHRLSAYDPLRKELGRFDWVVSLEVIEHVYDPRHFARTVFEVLSPGGMAIVSTPYHGWAKNVAMSLLGRFDTHVDPLRVHGHIKFWSRQTLTQLLTEAGLTVLEMRYAGRIWPLAKSMLAVAGCPDVRACARRILTA